MPRASCPPSTSARPSARCVGEQARSELDGRLGGSDRRPGLASPEELERELEVRERVTRVELDLASELAAAAGSVELRKQQPVAVVRCCCSGGGEQLGERGAGFGTPTRQVLAVGAPGAHHELAVRGGDVGGQLRPSQQQQAAGGRGARLVSTRAVASSVSGGIAASNSDARIRSSAG